MAAERGHLITDALAPRSLDVETRTRRYLLTMLMRFALFALVPFVPGLWTKAACAVGAAILPTFAVLLANAADNHTIPLAGPHPEDAPDLPSLSSGETIRGTVVDG